MAITYSDTPDVDTDEDTIAIAGLSGSGLIARTANGAAEVRTITAGSGIAVANGNGVSGNPTVSLGDLSGGSVTATGETSSRTLAEWMARHEDEDDSGHIPLEGYSPTITRNAFDAASGYYRHVPSIYMRSGVGAVFYTYHPSNASESQSGQLVGFRRTSDNGVTFGALTAELNSSTYATNPLTPATIQAESRINYIDTLDEEWAVVTHRSSEETAFLCKRDATSADPSVNKWTARRLQFSTTTGKPQFSSTITGAATTGYALEATIDGVANLAPLLCRPVQFQDGRFAIPVELVTTYGVLHRIAVLYSDAADPGDDDWEISGLVPLGDLGAADSWEPDIVQTDAGIYRMLIRDINGSENTKFAVTESTDLISWTPAKHNNANIHSNRISLRRISRGRYIGCGTSHYTNRNDLVLMTSRDGAIYSTQGLALGNEVDGTEFIHYSDVDEDSGTIYAVFSIGQTGDPAPNEIHFASLPTWPANTVPLMGSAKNAVEDNDPTMEATVSGDILTIPVGGGAMATPGGLATVFTRRWYVETAPATNGYQLFTIGTGAAFVEVWLNTSDGIDVVNLEGETISTGITLNDPTKPQIIQIMIDRRRRVARIYEVEVAIPSWSQLGYGDTYNDAAAADGEIYIDAAQSYDRTIEPDRLSNALGGLGQHIDDLKLDGYLGFGPPTALTIASGAITVTRSSHTIDTEGAAASDDLDTINGGKNGDILILRTVNSARDVVVTHATGNIYTGGYSRTLSAVSDRIVLQKTGSDWVMLTRNTASDFVQGNLSVYGFLCLAQTSTLTIASGVITPTGSNHLVDTEGAAATDDLDTITATNVPEGALLVLKTVASARDVVLKNATGNIFCGADRTLNTLSDRVTLLLRSGNWYMTGLADN